MTDPILTERFEDALAYAARIHNDQVRKGIGIPYVSHLLGVASIALEHGADEDTAIGALLHDAAEDQGGRTQLEAIRARFGERVAAIVDACTDTYDDPKPAWRARKEAYVASIAGKLAEGRLVSASDKLHNARSVLADYRSVGDALWSRFTTGKEGQLWYYGALVAAFREAGDNVALVDELARVVRELTRLVRAADHSPMETEIKFRLAGADGAEALRARLQDAGAYPGTIDAEQNRLYDQDGAIRKRGEVLRIRGYAGERGGVLTWKGPRKPGVRVKQSEEVEVRVDDVTALAAVVERVGFSQTVFYAKRREAWRFDDAGHAGPGTEVAIDELSGVGWFCEVEAADAATAERAAAMLGLGGALREERGYATLVEHA